MKKLAFILYAIAFFSSSLRSAEYQAEIKGGYFIPTGALFRGIYGGGGIYQFELNRSLASHFDAWTSVGYFSQDGHSIGQRSPTDVTLVPIGLGIKTKRAFQSFCAYAGIGIEGVYLHTSDHSPFVIQSVSKWGVGAIGKIGVLTQLYRGLSLDFFGDYSYCEIPFHTHPGDIVERHPGDVSGFSIGLGLNYCWNSCRY